MAARAHAALVQPGDDLRDPLGRRRPVQLARAHHDALVVVCLGHRIGVALIARRLDDDADRQAVLAGELEVALVVRRHAHDRAGSVLHQHVRRHEARDALVVHRIDRADAQRQPLARGRLVVRGSRVPLQAVQELLDRLGGPAALRQGRHQRVLGREHEERDSPQRVGPRREDGDLVAGLVDAERDLGTLGPADPVPLLCQHPVGPVPLQLSHVVQQAVGVVGDLEEPLDQVAADDQRVAALAAAADDLLVGQDGLVHRAPVRRRKPPVGQPAVEQLQEEPLRPVVVVGVTGVELRGPSRRHTRSGAAWTAAGRCSRTSIPWGGCPA